MEEKKFYKIIINTNENTPNYGEDIIVPYSLKSKKIYGDDQYIVVKYPEYYRKKYYNGEKLTEDELWLVALTARSFTELYEITSKLLPDEERDAFINNVVKVCQEEFILHEQEKEKAKTKEED